MKHAQIKFALVAVGVGVGVLSPAMTLSAQTINYTPPLYTIALSSDSGASYSPYTSASGVAPINYSPQYFVPMCSATGQPPFSQCSFASSGAVSSVSNNDGTLTVTPTTGAVIASLNLAHANNWTGVQTFTNGFVVPSGGVGTFNTGGFINANEINGTTIAASLPLAGTNGSSQLVQATQAGFNGYLTSPGPIGGTAPNQANFTTDATGTPGYAGDYTSTNGAVTGASPALSTSGIVAGSQCHIMRHPDSATTNHGAAYCVSPTGSTRLEYVSATATNGSEVWGQLWTCSNTACTYTGSSNAALTSPIVTVTRYFQGSVETVASSATPTFSNLVDTSQITLAQPVTSSTLAAGANGQKKTIHICQPATGGPFTFTWPANVRGGGTIGTTSNTCNDQAFWYSTSASLWYATAPMIMNM